MSVYRIHIRPKGGKANPDASFAYCLKKQVLGLGWQTKSQISGVSWDAYEKEAKKIHGADQLSRVRFLKNKISPNDLIWTRDTKGCYYLAKVLSGWEYYTNHEAQDADITNVVRCKIIRVESVCDVPGKVIACFRPSRTIQGIKDPIAEKYSYYLWNRLSGVADYEVDAKEFKNIFTFLDSEQAEDVVFIYLQTKGWIVVPNSRKADTMNYEFYLIHKKYHHRAIVQVKTGRTRLDVSKWSGIKEHVILFQANGYYENVGAKNVECLNPEVLEGFVYNNLELMPENIAHWAKTCPRVIAGMKN
ncbi:MAG: hypothetical protein ABH844_00680 [Candidatus Omnitrophota bacterium]